ncbi:uncharacterized protein ASCRUDRAFT_69940 [Ascoidea rubescens DSM 1968]|uniref:Uncharacterized protein n=1 Tax=Ascoidea rubescens DSM 1968 TaxID=1344418 RepID=A0A1D2VIJ2_9ASCO|nr:hypothetical protein ASCRUDRAFT_69940 [Ascoidea rubescens DSM 1968]ODV61439.1 hypothetical protein ASCRUDRAFT_69940 [Ascoidea rubescens DSM 1968]
MGSFCDKINNPSSSFSASNSASPSASIPVSATSSSVSTYSREKLSSASPNDSNVTSSNSLSSFAILNNQSINLSSNLSNNLSNTLSNTPFFPLSPPKRILDRLSSNINSKKRKFKQDIQDDLKLHENRRLNIINQKKLKLNYKLKKINEKNFIQNLNKINAIKFKKFNHSITFQKREKNRLIFLDKRKKLASEFIKNYNNFNISIDSMDNKITNNIANKIINSINNSTENENQIDTNQNQNTKQNENENKIEKSVSSQLYEKLDQKSIDIIIRSLRNYSLIKSKHTLVTKYPFIFLFSIPMHSKFKIHLLDKNLINNLNSFLIKLNITNPNSPSTIARFFLISFYLLSDYFDSYKNNVDSKFSGLNNSASSFHTFFRKNPLNCDYNNINDNNNDKINNNNLSEIGKILNDNNLYNLITVKMLVRSFELLNAFRTFSKIALKNNSILTNPLHPSRIKLVKAWISHLKILNIFLFLHRHRLDKISLYADQMFTKELNYLNLLIKNATENTYENNFNISHYETIKFNISNLKENFKTYLKLNTSLTLIDKPNILLDDDLTIKDYLSYYYEQSNSKVYLYNQIDLINNTIHKSPKSPKSPVVKFENVFSFENEPLKLPKIPLIGFQYTGNKHALDNNRNTFNKSGYIDLNKSTTYTAIDYPKDHYTSFFFNGNFINSLILLKIVPPCFHIFDWKQVIIFWMLQNLHTSCLSTDESNNSNKLSKLENDYGFPNKLKTGYKVFTKNKVTKTNILINPILNIEKIRQKFCNKTYKDIRQDLYSLITHYVENDENFFKNEYKNNFMEHIFKLFNEFLNTGTLIFKYIFIIKTNDGKNPLFTFIKTNRYSMLTDIEFLNEQHYKRKELNFIEYFSRLILLLYDYLLFLNRLFGFKNTRADLSVIDVLFVECTDQFSKEYLKEISERDLTKDSKKDSKEKEVKDPYIFNKDNELGNIKKLFLKFYDKLLCFWEENIGKIAQFLINYYYSFFTNKIHSENILSDLVRYESFNWNYQKFGKFEVFGKSDIEVLLDKKHKKQKDLDVNKELLETLKRREVHYCAFDYFNRRGLELKKKIDFTQYDTSFKWINFIFNDCLMSNANICKLEEFNDLLIFEPFLSFNEEMLSISRELLILIFCSAVSNISYYYYQNLFTSSELEKILTEGEKDKFEEYISCIDGEFKVTDILINWEEFSQSILKAVNGCIIIIKEEQNRKIILKKTVEEMGEIIIVKLIENMEENFKKQYEKIRNSCDDIIDDLEDSESDYNVFRLVLSKIINCEYFSAHFNKIFELFFQRQIDDEKQDRVFKVLVNKMKDILEVVGDEYIIYHKKFDRYMIIKNGLTVAELNINCKSAVDCFGTPYFQINRSKKLRQLIKRNYQYYEEEVYSVITDINKIWYLNKYLHSKQYEVMYQWMKNEWLMAQKKQEKQEKQEKQNQ